MTAQTDTAVPPPKQDPETLVLRGQPRPTVRFRRSLIVGITGAVAAALIGLSWIALEPPRIHSGQSALGSDEPTGDRAPDALADVPRSYSDVPRLGPPLPGDLGRAIVDQQREVRTVPLADQAAGVVEPAHSAAKADHERVEAAREAARSSPLLVQLGEGSAPAAPPIIAAESSQPPTPRETGAQVTAAAIPESQQRKIDFARAADGNLNPNALRPPPSPWTLSAGTIIPASLVTGLNSDLPGIVIAQVTESVRDSATGRTILIPQGARLIGSYDSVVASGQRRALLVWTRILFPDGSSIGLDHMPSADSSGYMGVRDGVDSHSWQLIKGIALSTLLGVGAQLSLGSSESNLVRAIRESAQQNAANAGNQITNRNLDVQPTITVRPGWPVRAIVNTDLVLQPWRG